MPPLHHLLTMSLCNYCNMLVMNDDNYADSDDVLNLKTGKT